MWEEKKTSGPNGQLSESTKTFEPKNFSGVGSLAVHVFWLCGWQCVSSP